MKIAILIGISKYHNFNDNLPVTKIDLTLMKNLIKSSGKYDKILCISNSTNADDIREQLLTLQNLKNRNIKEVFFYYTGHGSFDGNDFYYICSDSNFEDEKTFLKNSEIDNFLKGLNPEVVVKVIDACNSGVLYVKGDMDKQSTLQEYFEKSKGEFQNCYFFCSSRSDQFSGYDSISYFTKSFLRAISLITDNEIKYVDIISFIENDMKNPDQTPIFLLQGTGGHIFCKINRKVEDLLSSINESLSINTNLQVNTATLVNESAFNGKGEIIKLIKKIQGKKILLSECLAETLEIAQKYDDKVLTELCTNELIGWNDKKIPDDGKIDYRVIEIFCTIFGKVDPNSWIAKDRSTFFSYVENHPEEFFRKKMTFSNPISILEQDTYSDPNKSFIELTDTVDKMFSDELPPVKAYCYVRSDINKIIVEKLRTELTNKLLKLLNNVN